MLETRVKTAAVLLPVVIALVLFAPAAMFSTFILAITMWALYELIAMLHAGIPWMALIAIAGAAPALQLIGRGAGPALAPAAIILGAILLTIAVGKAGALEPTSWIAMLAGMWIGALFPYFALLRNAAGGIAQLILVILLVVASDTGAYFAGRAIGRNKLLPRVSPHKTIEGAIGGLLACIVAALILHRWTIPQVSRGATVWLAIVVGVLAQIGDLVNSAIKRIAGVKDSGWIFPGHGGLLDRTCSLVFPVVFTYYYLR